MKEIFDKIRVTCHTCGTPLNGEDIPKIGDEYYCQSDYEKASPEEKIQNKTIEDDYNFWTNILGTDTAQLALNHNFTTSWTVVDGTATSAKVWTSEASGRISKEFNFQFGKWYKLKVISTKTAGFIICYNSNDGTKELGTDNFETTFVALTDYIEFRNNSASTNTISLIEIRAL